LLTFRFPKILWLIKLLENLKIQWAYHYVENWYRRLLARLPNFPYSSQFSSKIKFNVRNVGRPKVGIFGELGKVSESAPAYHVDPVVPARRLVTQVLLMVQPQRPLRIGVLLSVHFKYFELPQFYQFS